jgi:tartrate dehydratase alpha subunit/fumarate hydratase class I-like protein
MEAKIVPPPPPHERRHEVAVGIGGYFFALGVFTKNTPCIAAGLTILVVSCRLHSRADIRYWEEVVLRRDRKV